MYEFKIGSFNIVYPCWLYLMWPWGVYFSVTHRKIYTATSPKVERELFLEVGSWSAPCPWYQKMKKTKTLQGHYDTGKWKNRKGYKGVHNDGGVEERERDSASKKQWSNIKMTCESEMAKNNCQKHFSLRKRNDCTVYNVSRKTQSSRTTIYHFPLPWDLLTRLILSTRW